MPKHLLTGNIVLDLIYIYITLVIHNLIISYDAAHYHIIKINVAIYCGSLLL